MGDDLIERLKATEGHTRGPWKANKYDHITADNNEDVALVGRWLGDEAGDPEGAANAALIALAPEMKARVLSEATDILAARVTVAGRSMTVAELIAAHERAVEALEWYAEPVLTYAITQMSEPRSAVHADNGRRAREALRPLPAPPTPTETEGA